MPIKTRASVARVFECAAVVISFRKSKAVIPETRPPVALAEGEGGDPETMNQPATPNRGFTLIELLIVIAIIGFLAAAVLVAVDPVRRIRESRDARRSEEAYSILNAILNKQVDEREQYDGETDAPILTQAGDSVQVIVEDTTGIDCATAATRPGCDRQMEVGVGTLRRCVANLEGISPRYISSIPIDPRGPGKQVCETGSSCVTPGDKQLGVNNSGYYIARTADGRIEIGACRSELAETISTNR